MEWVNLRGFRQPPARSTEISNDINRLTIAIPYFLHFLGGGAASGRFRSAQRPYQGSSTSGMILPGMSPFGSTRSGMIGRYASVGRAAADDDLQPLSEIRRLGIRYPQRPEPAARVTMGVALSAHEGERSVRRLVPPGQPHVRSVGRRLPDGRGPGRRAPRVQ